MKLIRANTLFSIKTIKTLSAGVLRRLTTVPEHDTHPPPPEQTTASTSATKIPTNRIITLLRKTNADEWLTNTYLREIFSSSPELPPYKLLTIARKLGSYEKSLRFFHFIKDNHACTSLSTNCLPPVDSSSLSLIFQAVIEHACCQEGPETLIQRRNLFKIAREQKLLLSTNVAVRLMKCLNEAELRSECIVLYNELDPTLRNTMLGNLMLVSLLKVGQVDNALKVLDEMFKSESSNCYPNMITLDTILSASFARNGSGRRATLDEIMRIVSRFMEKKMFPDAIWLTKLVTMFCSRGSSVDAWGLLHEVMRFGGRVETPSCNALLTCLVKENNYKRMNLLMKEMKEKDIKPNVVTFGILINHLCKNRRIDDAMEVFRNMTSGREGDEKSRQPDVVIFNTLINGLCKVGRQKEGLKLMENMKEIPGCMPNNITYNSLIDGFCKSGEIDSALELYNRMSKDGVEPNVVTMNTILNGMCRREQVSRAMDFSDMMQAKGLQGNAVTYTVLITAFCHADNTDKAMKLFHQLLESGVRVDVVVYYSLISGLSRAEKMDDASNVVLKMKEAGFRLDTISYNSLISGFFRRNMFDKAVELFEEMKDTGFKPDRVTYNTLISYFCSKGDMEQASKAIKMMREDGIFTNVVTYGALIDAYCNKLGDIDEAMKIFEDMNSASQVSANTVIYNILIGYLSKIHRIEDAFSLLNGMKSKGVRPNTVTYNALLKGIREKACYEKACEVMNQMTEDGCIPDTNTMNILTEWFSDMGRMDQLRSFFEVRRVSDMKGCYRSLNQLEWDH